MSTVLLFQQVYFFLNKVNNKIYTITINVISFPLQYINVHPKDK